MSEQLQAMLVMSDGTTLCGRGAGARGIASGELVFQTGMTGYQEALTDPSYAGQMLIFTYPLVGNYGVGPAANQSDRIHLRGVAMRDLMQSSGHRNSSGNLDAMLRAQGIPAITGVDTRYMVRKVREHGVLPAALAVGPAEELPAEAELMAIARSVNHDTVDFVQECSTPELVWHAPATPDGPRIALIDYGAKNGILERLKERGAGVWLIPASASAEEIMQLRPDGIFLSNGPGDPSRLDYAVGTVRALIEHAGVPIFGVCLGNQLIALSAGGRTNKMRFGHRGVNQPVLEVETGRVYLTTQNHGYVVDAARVPNGYRVTHTNLNDKTVEGIAHFERPVWGVQWHPEASPGPTDTAELFDRFLATLQLGCETYRYRAAGIGAIEVVNA